MKVALSILCVAMVYHSGEALPLDPEFSERGVVLPELADVVNVDLLRNAQARKLDYRRNSDHTITKYMTDCQYRLMLKITSYFETSDLNLGFNACETTDDGQGISAGFIQFTTCSGSALQVCLEYQQLKPSAANFCNKYITSLTNAIDSSHCSETTGKYTDDGLGSFCTDWSATANSDPLFPQAQEIVQKKSYFDSITFIFDKYKLKTPLAMGFVYDTAIQLGPLGAQQLTMSATAMAGGSPASGVDEGRWIGAFITARRRYLIQVGGAYADTIYRVDAYQSILKRKNLQFRNERVTMDIWGETVVVGC